jgi:hypothetical protein
MADRRSAAVVVLDQFLAVRRRWRERRGEWWAVGGGLVIGCTAIIAVTALVIGLQSSSGHPSLPAALPATTSPPHPAPLPAGQAPPGARGGGPAVPARGGPAGGGPVSPGGEAGGAGTATSTPPAEMAATAAPLTARYATESTDVHVLGYRGSVTIANPGGAPVDGWTVTVTLPPLQLAVSGVTGANATQDGNTWTFTPDADTGRVPAGGSVRIGFQVTGVTVAPAPTGCTIDGRPCAGVR